MNFKRLYEINARVFLNGEDNVKGTFGSIPGEFWDSLKEKGIDFVYLMGIWKVPSEGIKHCYEEGLVDEYKNALKDYTEHDVAGSPFAIEDYIVNPAAGTEEELAELKKVLNSRGMKLILDFIPNHFGSESGLVDKHPEIFLHGNEEYFADDPHTFFKKNDKIFAHGRDPFFPAWQDTVQVNYYNPEARKFMTGKLEMLSELCDGVRCDMAMLPLNNIFRNTWSGTLEAAGFEKPENEFWEKAIPAIKRKNKDFLFIAEAYWDLEYNLQKLGFDYTYDKKLTDRLRSGSPGDIRDHFYAEDDYQAKSIRFIENHDEARSLAALGKHKAKAAAVIISTIRGMQFYFHGQFEGKRIRVPVQLNRAPKEQFGKCMSDFYEHLLKLTNEKIFREGGWRLIEPSPAWDGNLSNKNMLAWLFTAGNEKRLVVVNYSGDVSQCRIQVSPAGKDEKIKFEDLLNGQTYSYFRDDINSNGIYIELNPWKAHIFKY